MKLLTPELRERLLANGRQRDVDHVPVVRFFNPLGTGTWLATELDEDDDVLFRLADLGFGCPEVESFGLSELQSIRLPFDMAVERDLHFIGRFRLSTYAEAACAARSIPKAERALDAAADDQWRAGSCAGEGEGEG